MPGTPGSRIGGPLPLTAVGTSAGGQERGTTGDRHVGDRGGGEKASPAGGPGAGNRRRVRRHCSTLRGATLRNQQRGQEDKSSKRFDVAARLRDHLWGHKPRVNFP